MADLSDVINGLKAVILATIYPAGTSNPNSPVNGVPTILKGGWPIAKNLDADLAAGRVTISVFTGTTERNTTRFLPKWEVIGTIAAGATSARVSNEVGRTLREFQISVWSNSPALRDVTAAAVDLALRSLRNLPLPDGSVAWITYSRSIQDDGQQKENAYIRHLFYSVEYGTFKTMTVPLVTTVTATVHGGFDTADLKITTITVTGD